MSRSASPTDSRGPVVAVVPARGGSKGVARKNLRTINGRSLLARAVRAGLSAAAVTHVLVTTDDDEIADASDAAGASWTLRRPPELADDEAPMAAVLSHALADIRDRLGEPQALVLLQPTSPFRTAVHVDAACAELLRTGAATVVTVQRVPHHYTPGSLMRLQEGRLVPAVDQASPALRRQDKPLLYARNGPAVLVVRPAVLDQGKLYGEPTVPFEMGRLESFDIDSELDLAVAEALCAAGLVDGAT